jgi:tetratricopeptide (TPR) repeat protein
MSDSLPDFDALWDYNQPAETEQKFRALLDSLTLPDDAPYRLQLLTQIARTQGLQRQFDEAHQTLDTVEPHIHANPVVAIRYHLERGRTFRSFGTPEKSRDHFMQAWDTARAAHEDSFGVDAAHMIAMIEPPEKQHEWNLKALDIVEKSDNPRAKKWAGSLYNNIGWTYHETGDYTNALDMFEKALAFREAHKQEREARIARWAVARAMRSLGRIPEALAIQERLLKEWEQAGEESDGYVYEELAECFYTMGAGEEAKKYFALAYAALSKDEYLAANEPARLERLKQLGTGQGRLVSRPGNSG